MQMSMEIRMTKKRQDILNVLKKHHGTLSAAEVHKLLPALDLVTIYRNLELFTNARLIKRVALDTNEARYEFQSEPHHHALCVDCHKTIHFKASDERIKKLLNLNDFSIEEIEIVVRGKCVPNS